jgi:hypothetical protein
MVSLAFAGISELGFLEWSTMLPDKNGSLVHCTGVANQMAYPKHVPSLGESGILVDVRQMNANRTQS